MTVPPIANRGNVSEGANTLQAQLALPCYTCFSLDARKIPIDTKRESDDWARREYNVAVGTPSRKLRMNSSQLLTSVSSGCIYCRLIGNAINSIRSGWENEESFIEVFLCLNLPVVVRWVNGRSVKLEAVWDESLGGSLDHEAKVRVPDSTGNFEEEVEFEIYRPELPQPNNDSILGPLVSHIGAASEIPSHSGDLECLRFVSYQATTCLQNHNCGSRMPRLPDRVIWVNPDHSGDIRLVEPKDVNAQYIALSYCWGPLQPDTFLTNAATFADRLAGIKASDLPPLFICIISYAQILRINYIWIDRLCIIQGDSKDWNTQAPKMGQYYGNATISITTASADTEMDDIIVERDEKWGSYNLQIGHDQIGSQTLRFRRRPYPLGTESRGGNYGRVSTRAWIWQERLLAARTVTFTPSALKFECRQHSVWEGYGQHVTSPSWSARLDDITPDGWWTLIDEFTRRDITKSSDRLPAIHSVMQRIASARGWVPIWGMWKDSLSESLAWQALTAMDGLEGHSCRMHPQYYAPSWSWASIDGPINSGQCMPLDGLQKNDPYLIKVSIQNVEPVTGVLTVYAFWNFALIRCRIERPYTKSAEPITTYRYHCTTVLGNNQSTPMPVWADVALRPVQRELSLLEDGTIERVPYGMKLPQQTWECKCLCILLGNIQGRANVLLLGESSRIPGAYERIGMAPAWPPSMFTKFPPRSFRIA
ncbi:HET-domain-containing protein [Macroventuria anomochaeta]|uniref:HET-domain-containing protein n=1 Tax=Macroventuria anomochaeta TaxID=301207 RepID=A0ACB6RUX6_9PLEO|nr:HET-domain-containing protein [Macroventuria anomochaeta]KAF2624697.1 HET-domain-containing protein [Macroventuria anomochaeta]